MVVGKYIWIYFQAFRAFRRDQNYSAYAEVNGIKVYADLGKQCGNEFCLAWISIRLDTEMDIQLITYHINGPTSFENAMSTVNIDDANAKRVYEEIKYLGSNGAILIENISSISSNLYYYDDYNNDDYNNDDCCCDCRDYC